MAQRAVQQHGVSIRSACQAFQISQACYRYVAQRSMKDDEISQWLLRLTLARAPPSSPFCGVW